MRGSAPRARYADVSEYLLKGGAGGYSSDSAVETDEEEQAAAPDFGRAAPKAEKVSIKLHELGPRLRLELVKVQEGLCDGAVLYHSHVTKTGDEVNWGPRRPQRTKTSNETEQRRKRRDPSSARRPCQALTLAPPWAEIFVLLR